MTDQQTISLRAATEHDAGVLQKLSALDSKPALRAPAVVALVDGRPVAAASLSDASVVADPFVPTAEVVELLQARIAGSAVAAQAKARRRPLLPRLPRLRPAA
jgi:hypothetical protein